MSQSFRFHITGEESGLRIDEFLASRFGSLSRLRIASLVSAGACLVNQKTAQAGWRVAIGDRVELALDEGPPTAMTPEPVPLEILYEDNHLVVVVKPAGLLVHPTKSVKHGTLANALAYHLNRDFYESSEPGLPSTDDQNLDDQNLEDQVARPANQGCENSDSKSEAKSYKPVLSAQDSKLRAAVHGQPHSLVRPGIVHRLDRPTSGLMVIAKTARALSILSRHFHRRLVKKRYLALVRGVVSQDEGSIKAPIGRDPHRQPHWWVTESGKEAESRFFVRERFTQTTLIELEPVTGRTNQLRIHCAYSGYPIIGDELYFDCGLRIKEPACGSYGFPIADSELKDGVRLHESAINECRINESAINESARSPEGSAQQNQPCVALDPQPAVARRLCLHAWQLAFHHPANGEWLEFTSPLPEDFAHFIERSR